MKIVDVITVDSSIGSDSSNSKYYKNSSLNSTYHVQLLEKDGKPTKKQNENCEKIIVGSKNLRFIEQFHHFVVVVIIFQIYD